MFTHLGSISGNPPVLLHSGDDFLLVMTHPPRITDESVIVRWMGLLDRKDE
jgi:hypothetical protein